MARPKVYKAEEVAKDLEKYIKETEDPMIEEFCLPKDRPGKDTLYRLEKECTKLSDAIKSCHAKQQVRTVRNVEAGKMNPTWAIFKMKQPCYGWTDKQEIEHSGEVTNKQINIKRG